VSTVIGVYHDTHAAEAAAHAQHEHGLGDEQQTLNGFGDAEREITAEMEAEVTHGWGSPGLGTFLTSEQMQGATLFALVFGAVGAVVMIPVGLLLFTHTDNTLTRLLIGMLVGGLFGSTVGALLGGGFAMQSTDQPLAGEVGVTLRVECDDEDECTEVMRRFEPIRIDRWDQTQHIETLLTEEPHGIRATLEQFTRNAGDPRHRD
jgi:hypothetical protein